MGESCQERILEKEREESERGETREERDCANMFIKLFKLSNPGAVLNSGNKIFQPKVCLSPMKQK